jgi:ABC-type amino acid transport substrate-binding protein
MPEPKLLLLDSPSALFLAVKTGRAQAFAIDNPIADFYESRKFGRNRFFRDSPLEGSGFELPVPP